MRHYRRFAPALNLAAEAYGRAVTSYEGFDDENRALGPALADELGRVLGARSTLDHFRYIQSFEARFAAWCGRRHGVGLGSCTDALELTLAALGVGPGDEVITSAHTFIATGLAIHHAGATPVLVDPEPGDLCLSAAAVERALTPRTMAILPVHMHGHVGEIERILEIGQAAGVPVVEDCAQATGARLHGRRAPFGTIGCFSFYPSKPLGGIGNGGMLVTDDDALAERVRTLRDPDGGDPALLRAGRTPSFLHPVDVAVLTLRLDQQDERQRQRAARAAHYSRALAHLDPLVPRAGLDSAWGAFVLRSPDRDRIRRRLLTAGFETKVEYATPWFESPTVAGQTWARGDWPVARRAAAEGLSLPLRPTLSIDQCARIARIVAEGSG